MNLSKAIEVACAKQQWRQKDLAGELGVTDIYLSRVKKVGDCKLSFVRRMADICGVSPSEFVEWGE